MPPSSVTGQPPFSSPSFPAPLFGQFPFSTQLPPTFPPPSVTVTNGSSENAAHVPRFPLPFVSPFYPMMMPPPGFAPWAPPQLPRAQVPPWQQTMTSQAQQTTAPSAGESVSRQESGDTTTQGNTTSQTNGSHPTNTDGVTESEDTDGSATGSGTNATAESESRASESSSQATNLDGVRHRNVTRPASAPEASVRTDARPAELRTHTRSLGGDIALLVFALFVLTVIVLLIIRRLRMMNLLPSIL